MPEAVANLTPAGAGRIIDWMWPGVLTALGGGNYDANCTARNGMASSPGSGTGLGGGTTAIAAVRNGVPCVNMQCGPGAAGLTFNFVNPFALGGLNIKTSKSNMNALFDDQMVMRVIWTFCGSGLAVNANQDHGLEFLRNSNIGGRIVVNGFDGWGFRVQDANTLTFLVRGPNGFLSQNLTAAPFDVTAWHTLDMIISSATSSADATFEVRLDDAPLNMGAANSSWGPGTNLPPAAVIAGVTGWFPELISAAGNNNGLFTHQLRIIAAPTRAMVF